MANKALCVGINEYPLRGMDLKGCVNDARAWASVLTTQFDFASGDVTLLLDERATKKKFVAELKALLRNASRGDVLVFTASLHGTYLADTEGDEARFDAAFCPWDCQDALLMDDELQELFEDVPAGAHVTAVQDTCHAGSITRAMLPTLAPDKRRVRFMNPFQLGLRELGSARAQVAQNVGSEARSESSMKHVIVTACTDRQYAYDAKIGTKFHGVMTYHALTALEEARWDLTYTHWMKGTSKLVSNAGYDQEPQLEGPSRLKRIKVFR